MARSPRAGNRREMYRRLLEAKKTIDLLRHAWDVSGTVYVDRADRKPGDNAWLRPREINEYPENSRIAWANTYHTLSQVIAELEAARDLARQRYHELPKSGAAQSAEQSGGGDE